MNNLHTILLAIGLLIQIGCIVFSLLNPTRKHWIMTQLVELLFLIVMLVFLTHYRSLSDARALGFTKYWPIYMRLVKEIYFYGVVIIATLILKVATVNKSIQSISPRALYWDAVVGLFCGLISFAVYGFQVQVLFVSLMHEVYWGVFCIVLPVVFVVLVLDLFGGMNSGFIWVGFSVHFAMQILFGPQIYATLNSGADIYASGWIGFGGWFTHTVKSIVYSFVITLLQFVLLLTTNLIRYFRNRHR